MTAPREFGLSAESPIPVKLKGGGSSQNFNSWRAGFSVLNDAWNLKALAGQIHTYRAT